MIPLTAALDVIITWNAASDKVVTVMIFVFQINNLQQIQLDTEMKKAVTVTGWQFHCQWMH